MQNELPEYPTSEEERVLTDDIAAEVEAKGFAIRENMPEGNYRAYPAWSQSQLKLFPDWPELFYGYHIAHLWPFKRTNDMELGTQLHAVHLEKEELLIIPPDALSSNGQRRGKNWDAWKQEHPDNPGILEKDSIRIRAMCSSLESDSEIKKIIDADGLVEHSIFWIDPATGLRMKGRLDKMVIGNQRGVIFDLKSTSIDVTNKRLVDKHIFEMGYHKQQAMYVDAAKLAYGIPFSFLFGFVRSKPPYTARLWQLESKEDIDLGRRHIDLARKDLKSRLETGDWHGGGHNRINFAQLPAYAYSDDPLDLSMPDPVQEYSEFNQFS